MYKKEKNNEIVENIAEYNLKIIQNKKYFKFGVDSVALAKFAASHRTRPVVLDACSGSGAVGLIYHRLIEDKVSKNKGYREIEKIFFIEKQGYFADLNKRNLEENNFKNFKVINKNIKDKAIFDEIEANSVDIILVNPPYGIVGSIVNSTFKEKSIARSEKNDFLEHFFSFAHKILKSNGEIFMVHRPERLVDIFCAARQNKIEPKTMKMVNSDPSKKPAIVLLRLVKSARPFLKIEDPFIINKD